MTDISIIALGSIVLSIFLLFITIKQVLGLPGYNIYYPLIAGLSWIAISPLIDPIVLILMTIVSTIAWFLHKRITQKYLSLLLYPRQGLYVSISIFFLIIGWFGLNYRNIIDQSINETNLIYFILGYSIILHIVPKVFGQGKGPLSLSRWIHNAWFVTLSILCASIISSSYLIQGYSRHPRMIIVLFLLCMIIGKYPGLQLIEILRFRRIINQKKVKSKKYTTQ